jgi:hypothetical protein
MKDRKSVLDTAIRVLYQFMLAAGTLFVIFATYLIAGGTTEAILMILPGLMTLGGGLVLRKIARTNHYA